MSGNTNQAGAAASQTVAGQRTFACAASHYDSTLLLGRPGWHAALCGAEKAFDSARACIRANEAIKQKARLTI